MVLLYPFAFRIIKCKNIDVVATKIEAKKYIIKNELATHQ